MGVLGVMLACASASAQAPRAITVEGEVDGALVRAAVERAQLAGCVRASTPTVQLAMVRAPNGRVTSVEVRASSGDPRVDRCLLARARRIRLARGASDEAFVVRIAREAPPPGSLATLRSRPAAGQLGAMAGTDRLEGLGNRAPPREEQTEADVRGALDVPVVVAVIRQHVDQIRFCYDDTLGDARRIEGRVETSFTIARDGSVREALIVETTLSNVRIERCIAAAIRRWTFPAPADGGEVVVRYPFVFHADE